VQATAAGVAVALGGLLRDVVGAMADRGWFGSTLAGPATGYACVYAVEIMMLALTIFVMSGLVGDTRRLRLEKHGTHLPVGPDRS
jgi:MFS transporter, BCD family, chlorophyll transporter